MTRSRNHYVTVTQGMSGHFAVMRAEYEDEPGRWFEDNVQTGIGRYKDRKQAEDEAREWAKDEEIPYK